MKDKRIILHDKLKKLNPSNLNMVIGFDGFVDEIIHVVDKRQDSNHFTRVETIEALASRIHKASGLSTNIELVPTNKKIGGNGPIMCNALSEHEANISYIGALGYPSIDDVFRDMKDNVSLYSIATNGHTDALEFDDGKLMLGKMASLNDVTYDNLIKVLPENELISLLNTTDLFATVNWSMLPYMTDLWESLLTNIVPKLDNKKRHMFIDLADPEKRENKEIKYALDMLKKFKKAFKVTLGLNKKEAYDVANVLALFDSVSLSNMQISLEDLTEALYQYLEIDTVVIHPVDRSCTMIKGTFYEAMGPYISKPKLTTGAGDNFNAGFMLGLMLNLEPEEALLTGMATSGFYVRKAKSPTFAELIEFLKEWAEDKI
jgi:hypothetical protein